MNALINDWHIHLEAQLSVLTLDAEKAFIINTASRLGLSQTPGKACLQLRKHKQEWHAQPHRDPHCSVQV
jgi:hypothetical protein